VSASADFLIIGGGIAGLSAAARLAEHGRAVVLEAEQAIGHHSSGRSVTFSHYGIGDAIVRGLTAYSRPFFETPPEGFSPSPLARIQSALYAGSEAALDRIDALHDRMAPFNPLLRRVDSAELTRLCPILRTGSGELSHGLFDPAGLKLDADALLQFFARAVRVRGGEVHTGQRIAAIEHMAESWSVRTEGGSAWSAPVLVNAAGAWADRIAELAGVQPLGLTPLRRTIIVVDPPAGMEVADWPFVHSVLGDFYMLPETGRLLVSPVDEIASDPCDAWPEEVDIATAAAKLEEYTFLQVRRIAHSWAGLRSFVSDRVPTAGFAPDAPGFFWLAGQGGYGLQTAPAMAQVVEALVAGQRWPEGLARLGVSAKHLLPDRLLGADRMLRPVS
jgi:D-arginine dehydrogenase